MDTTVQNLPRPYTRREELQLSTFWTWNLIFLAFMSFGFAPIMLPETITAVRTGTINPIFLVYALVLTCIPVAAVILGLTVLRRSPSRLFALGFVVEGPLMLMLAVRFFFIRQATPGTTLMMAIALLGMAAFLWNLLDPRAGKRHLAVEAIRLAGLTLMALTALYAAAWIAFYALPLLIEALRGLANLLLHLPRTLADLGRTIREMLLYQPLLIPFSVLGFILLVSTGALFLITPLAVPYLSFRAWWRQFQELKGRLGSQQPVALVAGTLVACGALFFVFNRQPQEQAFARLARPPASITEARAMLAESGRIRAGLLNAYLAPYRYISAQGEVRHVGDIYASTFRIPYERAFAVQRLYEGLAQPLLYRPVHPPDPANPQDNHALVEEPQEAARLYQSFFDTPITTGERETIVRAARSQWSRDRAETAWQAVDDREVHLVRQALSVQEHGDWAEMELQEVYQNQTAQEQEVIYYFNLPESAVLTGIWLGPTADKADADTFQVAPRGAAQAVYREQTRQMKDPALLEQIGPRQYRLRVFPIPPLRMNFDEQASRTMVSEAPAMYLWLDWRQMAEAGAWRLPQMALLRNVYWDGASERLVNGQPMDGAAEAWLPATLPATAPVEPQAHRVDLPGGQTVLAVASDGPALPAPPANTRLAVVLDRSRSMEAHAGEVGQALEALKGGDLAAPIDVYLTASPYRGEEPAVLPLDQVDPQQLVYFGGQNAAQLIAQFEALQELDPANRSYDAVILLTDGTGYELGESAEQISAPATPVWVVHLGGDLPLGYDDGTLEAIQVSGGGVAGTLDEALQRIAVAADSQTASGSPGTRMTDLLGGYLWTVLPADQAEAALPAGVPVQNHSAEDPFAALAARRLILAEMQRNRGTIDQVETLDALHALATKYGIVTPYSSMIVLVSWDQQALLDELSKLGDRYQREVETIGETTPSTPLPLAGVPEPHEWLLMGLAAALLIYIGLKKRPDLVQVLIRKF